MRYQLPRPNATRTRTKFLWFPRVMPRGLTWEWRWFERSSWVEEYCPIMGWHGLRWKGDKEP